VLALAGNCNEHIKEAALKRGFNLGLGFAPQTTVPPFLKPACIEPAKPSLAVYEDRLSWAGGRNQHMKCIPGTTAIHYRLYINDVSARITFTRRQKRPWDDFYDWLNGKWADGFCPMGPYLVTADEIADVQNLKMVLKVNDAIRQNANTAQMIYAVADIVSFLSHIMTLELGDVICIGTFFGVGVATGNFLKAGDRISAPSKARRLTTPSAPRPGAVLRAAGTP
jgi:hypothetical protein